MLFRIRLFPNPWKSNSKFSSPKRKLKTRNEKLEKRPRKQNPQNRIHLILRNEMRPVLFQFRILICRAFIEPYFAQKLVKLLFNQDQN
jgi:hypothetical protein